ncbi:MAG: hypothetical protein OEZ37_01880 [Gemmatimonadota bacterium]|nr:hypothetical protein [Gemmatimonadota bacterium]
MDADLRIRLATLCHEGWEMWDRFDVQVRGEAFHPFVAADYDLILAALMPLQASGTRFLEWGSATGVITILADLLGFDACGIELDPDLVRASRELASRWDSQARFAAGSFLPTGYRFRSPRGDDRLGTIGEGVSGYLELGRSLDDFDVVYGFPWGGEEAMMLDLMARYGRADALLLLNEVNGGLRMYRDGRLVS